MKQRAPELMTLDQLAGHVAEVLAVGYRGSDNGQVSAIPSRRTIRYYTTLGILDRPVEMRGRTALYGPRHLLQLVAIKRLQERGLSLVQVQEALAGMTERQLRQLAGSDLSGPAPVGDSGGEATARAADFWRSPAPLVPPPAPLVPPPAPLAPPPAPLVPPPAPIAAAPEAAPESAASDEDRLAELATPNELTESTELTDLESAPGATLDVAARTVHQVSLGMGVTLTLPACQPLLDQDLAAIRAAAGDLLVTLRERQFTEGDQE